jgi:hypothetical protein
MTSLRRHDVKLELDIVLCLRAYLPLEGALQGRAVVHPVRTLAELRLSRGLDGGMEFRFDDPVRESLQAWHRSSRDDYNKILARLEKIAVSGEISNTNVLKWVKIPGGKGLFEVVGKGDHARVFGFHDPPSGRIIVGAGTYWKLGRTKEKERRSQDAAIVQAAARRDLWIIAAPVPGLEEWRVLRTKKETRRP